MIRGEIWRVLLDPTIGAEIRKTRPAVILNDDAVGALPLRIMAPVARWKPEYQDVPWMVDLSETTGLEKRSAVDLFQIRSLSTTRCIERIGVVDSSIMEIVERQLCMVFGVAVFPEGER
ncbi:MAG: type II toxin-antitoxin system PemK/MazF family toxin [Spirochaeta sp.]|jgi:mRNA interferase MazF|nr:type II toxin-antitoxin system PemK/MazF family toxin [Spirochaeta sp.]